MEIVKTMNLPASALFETITRSVLADIQTHTGKAVDLKQLAGFEYIKNFSKDRHATIRIERFEKNKSYHFRTITSKNNFVAKYDLTPLEENSCQLRYVEEMESHGYVQKLNDAFVGLIFSRTKKKRFIQMLEQMEAAYSTGGA